MSTDSLTLSVIIPALNEQDSIQTLLICLSKQSLSQDLNLKILVIDNGSSDKTYEIAIKNQVYAYKITPSNRSIARNFGAKIALENNSDILIFLDCDCFFDKDFISQLIKPLLISDFTVSQALLMPRASTLPLLHLGYPFVDTKAFAIKSSDFKKIGFFDQHFIRCEDIDYGWRINQAGYKINIATGALCYTGKIKNIYQAIKRGYETAIGLNYLHKKWQLELNLSFSNIFIGFLGIAKRETLKNLKQENVRQKLMGFTDNIVTFFIYFFFKLRNFK